MRLEEKLAELRRGNAMSQEQLAHRLGVTRQSVSKWESGTAVPELNKLVALSELFGVSVDYLVKDWMEEESKPAAVQEELSADSAARLERKLDDLTWQYKSYHYSSRRKLFGLPLVDIRFGHGQHPCRENTAVGVLAIGNYAVGIVSIGLISLGVISLGMVSFGLLALGMVALGGIALGSVAIGVLAGGMVALGLYAVGISAAGMKLAVGLAASGAVAVGQKAEGARVLLTGSGVTGETVRAFLAPELAGLWPPLRELLLSLASQFG